eukprot:1161495-Heterocapsa_arctica.AAC.1
MKFAVTFGRPLGHKSGQVTDSAEKIETRQTTSIKDFHQNFCGNGLKNTHIGHNRRERPPVLCDAAMQVAVSKDCSGPAIISTPKV